MGKVVLAIPELCFGSMQFAYDKKRKKRAQEMDPMPLDSVAEFEIVFARRGVPTSFGFYFNPDAWDAGEPQMHLMSHDLRSYPMGAGEVAKIDGGDTAVLRGKMRASAENDEEVMKYATSYNTMLEAGLIPEASAGFFMEELMIWDKPDANGMFGELLKADGIETSRVWRGAHPDTSIEMHEASFKRAMQIAQGQASDFSQQEKMLEQLKQAEQLRELQLSTSW